MNKGILGFPQGHQNLLSASGADGSVQFALAKALASDTNLTWDNTLKILTALQFYLKGTSTEAVPSHGGFQNVSATNIIWYESTLDIKQGATGTPGVRIRVDASGNTDIYGNLQNRGTFYVYSNAFGGVQFKIDATGNIIQIRGVTTSFPSAQGAANSVLVNNGSGTLTWASLMNGICEGRLTLATGTPITTTDQTAKGTIYFTPYKGNRIALYTAAAWQLYNLTEISLVFGSFTAGNCYDVFIYDSAGLQLEMVAWTNSTTRATALALQDGVYCKTGSLDRRYVGTVYMKAATTTEDTLIERFVYNHYNRIRRKMVVVDATASWNYGSSTWRQANAAAANKLQFVIGVAEVNVEASVQSMADSAAGSPRGAIGVALDATNVNNADLSGQALYNGNMSAKYHNPGIAVGYHYLAWVESNSNNSGTAQFYGVQNSIQTSGIIGTIEA